MDTRPGGGARADRRRRASAAATALTELRDLVRGIHPPVLAERGLGDAVRALALDLAAAGRRSTVDLPGRLAGAGRVGGLLRGRARRSTNAAKHAARGPGPGRAARTPTAGCCGSTVTDDGRGGADPAARAPACAGSSGGSATFDGTLAVTQPARRADRRDAWSCRARCPRRRPLPPEGRADPAAARRTASRSSRRSTTARRCCAALLEHRPGRRGRRRAAAADASPTRGCRRRSRPAREVPGPAGPGALPARRAALRPGAARRRRRRRSATCSRTGSSTPTSSSTRCAGWPPAAPRWTRR